MTDPGAVERRGHRGGASAALPIHLALAALVGAAWLSPHAAADRGPALVHARDIALGGGLFVASWLVARHRALRPPLLTAIAVAGAAAGGYFLLQYRHLATPDVKVAMLDTLGRALSRPVPRVGEWAPFPNSLATLLEGLMPVAAGLALARGAAAGRVIAALAGGVMALALAVSASRGAWLAVLVGMAALVVPSRVWRWSVPVAAVAVAALLAWVGGTVTGGVPWWIDASTAFGRPDRLDVYGQAAALLRDVPFTGLGGGDQFAAAVSKYVLLIQVPFITYAHNLPLQLWLEDGLVGLAAWWALAAAVAIAAVAGERAGLGRRFRGVWAGLLAIHVHGLTDARQFADPWTWAPFFLLAGVLAGYLARSSVRLPRRAAWVPAAIGAGVIVAAVVGRGHPLAAWQANLGAVAQARADAVSAGRGGDGAADRAVAAARFTRALAIDPDDGPALRRAGMLAIDEARHADALNLLGRAWAVEPGHPPTRKAYGLAAVWSGDIALAADLLGPVPGMADELATWSRFRREQGETGLAIAAARTAVALAPAQPELAQWLRELDPAAR